MCRTPCNPTIPIAPDALEPCQNRFRVHRRSSRAGIVFFSTNSAMAAAGILTARPQFTLGSFRRASHARTVDTFKLKASAASGTVSKFFIFPSVAHDMISRACVHSSSTPH
jgi:hypothetical protein